MTEDHDIAQAFTLRLEKIERVIEQALPRQVTGTWVEDAAGGSLPVSLASLDAINAPGRELVMRGGKRWRPLVMLLCCEIAGGGDEALPLTPLVELPHNGSLIVDDIEDGSEVRRGGTAIHLLYGTDMAINTGTFLYFLPSFLIETCGLSDDRKLSLYRIYLRYLRRLHLGQGLDIFWHRDHRTIPGEEEYFAMCRMKTGCLAAMGAELGAVAGGGSEELAGTLGPILEDLGVAFQILDDVKNLSTGNPGKRRGDDVVEGKKSLPLILHLADRPRDLERLSELFRAASRKGIEGAEAEIEEFIGMLADSRSMALARDRALVMIEEVRRRIGLACEDTPSRTLLLSLMDTFHEKTPG